MMRTDYKNVGFIWKNILFNTQKQKKKRKKEKNIWKDEKKRVNKCFICLLINHKETIISLVFSTQT